MVKALIVSTDKTFEVYGDFNSNDLVEGKLYSDPKDNKLFYYSLKENRPNPATGFFPVWNGKEKFTSNFAKEKYFGIDTISIDLKDISDKVNAKIADNIRYSIRRAENNEILSPKITDADNMFTQCIKGVINYLNITMIDLVDMCKPAVDQHVIENYYSALTKITLMRMNKWFIWLDMILHCGFVLEMYNGKKKLLTYTYPSNKFDTGIVKYDNIINTDDDPFKKIVKIIMVMENIQKNQLKSEEIDDYTINNMMTTLSSKKPLSAQLFSRFVRMANLNYKIQMIKDGKCIFEYKE